jgi:hypothetical protein
MHGRVPKELHFCGSYLYLSDCIAAAGSETTHKLHSQPCDGRPVRLSWSFLAVANRKSGYAPVAAFESLPTTNQTVAQVSLLRPGMRKSLARTAANPCDKLHVFRTSRVSEARPGRPTYVERGDTSVPLATGHCSGLQNCFRISGCLGEPTRHAYRSAANSEFTRKCHGLQQ